ncbi:uncharacterized protein LOC118196281 [Stegodyphus dumicola]|uniref:uncharacterized protein LOC118196281 n=1 Tax=Stegodyphus dumicola TaxID=202533 RepID=UPI0015AD9282|nr:uncharacterized protein LOC118196281 [Stegodyphus dumicola]
MTSVFVIDKVCGNLPHVSLSSNIVNSFSDLILLDPTFYESAPIDILLEVNVFMSLVLGEPIKQNQELPTAVHSKLGWIISGTALVNSYVNSWVSLNNLELTTSELVKFWILETVLEESVLSKSEVRCEEHFKTFHNRDNTSRYVVRLPFKKSPSELGHSRELALKSFLLLENRLVIPRIQPELFDILIRFRTYAVAIFVDMEKMYRQIRVYQEGYLVFSFEALGVLQGTRYVIIKFNFVDAAAIANAD